MKIATLQFSPVLGAVQHNIGRANAFLESIKPGQLDLLVLPEMAFSGYNFPSLEAIKPFLEPTTAGPTTEWAIAAAVRLNCHITVGYPEICTYPNGMTKNFNSSVTVSPAGQILATYRKSFLFFTDETWSAEGPNGSSQQEFSPTDPSRPFFCGPLGHLGQAGHGICMDINPYKFEAPFTAYEFANTMLKNNVTLVILSMAWLTRLLPPELEIEPDQPDMETVAYWLERFVPFLERESREDIIVVFANRCGTEGTKTGSMSLENGEEVEEGDRVCYAGSSCVMKFQGSVVRMFDRNETPAIMGKLEEGVLAVDTSQHAKFSLTSRGT